MGLPAAHATKTFSAQPGHWPSHQLPQLQEWLLAQGKGVGEWQGLLWEKLRGRQCWEVQSKEMNTEGDSAASAPAPLRPGRAPQSLSHWRLHSDTPLRSWRVPCLEVKCLGTLRPGV